jgi:hypothetical protein
MLGIKVAHARAVGDDTVRPACQITVNRQFMPGFPGVHAALARHQMLDPGGTRRDAAIAIGGKQPGVHQVRLYLGNVLLQSPVGARVELVRFANDRQRHASSL